MFNKLLWKKRRMKGQGTAEYVVLLAIVLLIGIIAVVLVSGITSGAQTANESESISYWSGLIKPITIRQYGQVNDTLYLSVTNAGMDRIFLRKVMVDNVTADLGAGWAFKTGSVKTISIPKLPACSDTYDSFSYNVSFVYDTENILGQTEHGEKALVGYCTKR